MLMLAIGCYQSGFQLKNDNNVSHRKKRAKKLILEVQERDMVWYTSFVSNLFFL